MVQNKLEHEAMERAEKRRKEAEEAKPSKISRENSGLCVLVELNSPKYPVLFQVIN